MREGRGWYSRGYNPHIDLGEVPQFLTWRLADALPASVLRGWEEELEHEADSVRKRELARRIEAYCDQGHGECVLGDPRAARAMQEGLFKNHDLQYCLHAWSIMPNHVHVLLSPTRTDLETIVKTAKGASSHSINQIVGRSGRLWQPGFHDRYIRDSNHMYNVHKYIEWNPVKAKLCTDPARWSWSSACPDARARLDFLIDLREKGPG